MRPGEWDLLKKIVNGEVVPVSHGEPDLPVTLPRKIVQVKQFVNASQDTINEFLSKIPAEDIVSTHYFFGSEGDAATEYVGVFYKTDKQEAGK